MIDKQYIDAAKKIRNEFISLNNKLSSYEKEAMEMAKRFESISNEIVDLSKDKSKNPDALVEDVLKRAKSIEFETEKFSRLVEPINKRIEKLKEEERVLYNRLKEKYPKLSDEKLRDEIQKHL